MLTGLHVPPVTARHTPAACSVCFAPRPRGRCPAGRVHPRPAGDRPRATRFPMAATPIERLRPPLEIDLEPDDRWQW